MPDAMTLTQLEIFSQVAALRGFTLAAARLGISQSAVSHAIKSLEQELGVELVQRHQAQVELTDIGQRLLLRARSLLGLAETMRQEAADAKGMKQGTLRIGSFGPTASMRLLPALLADYRQRYPGIEIHVEEGPDQQVVQWLRERRIDIGFVVLPDESFDSWPLLEDRMVAVVPRRHPLAARDALSLRELCDDPFILTGAGSAELVMRLFTAAGLTPQIRYRCSQLLSTLDTVARGDGVTLLAELALPAHDQTAYVSRPLAPQVARRIGLAVLDQRQSSPATLAFVRLALMLRDAGRLAAGWPEGC